jgi:hypothetical protein
MQPLTEKFFNEVSLKIDPKAKIITKDKTLFMRFLTWFFTKTRINPAFPSYYTTIGSTINAPSNYTELDDVNVLEVIMHETIHMKDSKKWGLLFSLSYLFPQILGVFALLAFLSPWFLLFLLFLAPIPAYFRYYWEKRAFRISIVFARKVFKYTDEQVKLYTHSFIVNNLSERYYYWAMPFKSVIYKDLADESFMQDPFYKEFIDFVDKNLAK